MNSFALLQDDVEDATDFSPNVPKASAPDPQPANPVQDARSARDDRKQDSKSAPAQSPVEHDPEKEDPDHPEKPRPPPKEKDLTLEEYLAQKAQKSSTLTSLSKGARKANDGKSSGFENMSVLKKDDAANVAAEDSLMGSVPVKEVHENKALKDSTHAAVAKNAEIQSFFKKDPVSDRRPYNSGARRGSDYRRGSYDSRRGASRAPGRGFDDRAKTGDERPPRNDGRGSRYEGRGGRGDARGAKSEGRGGRYEGRGGRYDRGTERDYRRDPRGGYGRGSRANNDDPNGHSQGPRSYGNGPKVPTAPNVDDTAAFPSL